MQPEGVTMAQVFFITEEVKRKKRYEALVNRGIALWEHKAEDYRTLPFKYLFLRGLMKERGLSLRAIPKAKLGDYPIISFFEILERQEALVWLKEKDMSSLERELDEIDFLLKTSCAYTSMKSWMIDAAYRIDNKRPSLFSLAR